MTSSGNFDVQPEVSGKGIVLNSKPLLFEESMAETQRESNMFQMKLFWVQNSSIKFQ